MNKARRIDLSDPAQVADKPTMTIAAVAEMLQVSETFVRGEIHAGRLAAYALGGGWRVSANDLTEWIASKRVVPVPKMIAL